MKQKLVTERMDFLARLPIEISFQILDSITAQDLLSCSQVSKRWNKLTNDTLLWFKKCVEMKVPETFEFERSSFNNNDSLKQQYLDYMKLLSNWKHGTRTKPILVNVHQGHIVTGLILYKNWVASCSDDGSVAVLDLYSGEKLQSLLGHRGGVWSLVALCVDGRPLIATSSTDCTVRLWDLETGACIRVLTGHEKTVRCLATSQTDDNCDKSAKLISGSRDWTLRIWDVVSGQCEHLLDGHIGAIRCVRANSSRVVSGSYDHSVRVWDIQSGQCLFVLIGHTNRVFTLYLGRKAILSASLDTTIRVWNSENGICTHVLEGHRSLTCEIAMNSDESVVVSGNADNSVRVWLISSGECILQLDGGESKHSSALTSVQIVLDRLIVSSAVDGTVKLWNLNDGTFIRDIVKLENAPKGAVVWRSMTNNNHLVCAVGSHNNIERTKLFFFDFSVKQMIYKN